MNTTAAITTSMPREYSRSKFLGFLGKLLGLALSLTFLSSLTAVFSMDVAAGIAILSGIGLLVWNYASAFARLTARIEQLEHESRE